MSDFTCAMRRYITMMTPSNRNISRVNGASLGESTDDRWFPLVNACNGELRCFLWSAPEQTVEHNRDVETPWRPLWRHCNDTVIIWKMTLTFVTLLRACTYAIKWLFWQAGLALISLWLAQYVLSVSIKFVVCQKNTNSLIPMDVWLLLWLTSGDLGIMKPSEFILWPNERHTSSLCVIQTKALIGRISLHKIFKCTRRQKFFIVELRIRLLARNKYVTFHAHRYIITILKYE